MHKPLKIHSPPIAPVRLCNDLINHRVGPCGGSGAHQLTLLHPVPHRNNPPQAPPLATTPHPLPELCYTEEVGYRREGRVQHHHLYSRDVPRVVLHEEVIVHRTGIVFEVAVRVPYREVYQVREVADYEDSRHDHYRYGGIVFGGLRCADGGVAQVVH